MSSFSFNKFDSMPYIPYKIISHLAQDSMAEDFWKLLNYQDYDALSHPNLSLQGKLSLVCKNQSDQNNYGVFLTRMIENEQVAERSILKVYKTDTLPINACVATVCYELDILCGAKMSVVDYNGYPCSRLDVMETLLLRSLNGADVAGVGLLQFNYELSRLCRSSFGVGNNTSYVGTGIILATQVSNVYDTEC